MSGTHKGLLLLLLTLSWGWERAGTAGGSTLLPPLGEFFLIFPNKPLTSPGYTARGWGLPERRNSSPETVITCQPLVRASGTCSLGQSSTALTLTHPLGVPASSCLSCDPLGWRHSWGRCRGPRKGCSSIRTCTDGQFCHRNVAWGRGAQEEMPEQRQGRPGTTSQGQEQQASGL